MLVLHRLRTSGIVERMFKIEGVDFKYASELLLFSFLVLVLILSLFTLSFSVIYSTVFLPIFSSQVH